MGGVRALRAEIRPAFGFFSTNLVSISGRSSEETPLGAPASVRYVHESLLENPTAEEVALFPAPAVAGIRPNLARGVADTASNAPQHEFGTSTRI
jgi:hypothetical protein